MESKRQLFEIVVGLGAGRCFANCLHHRHQYCDQEGDDADYHDEPQQGKSCSFRALTCAHDHFLSWKKPSGLPVRTVFPSGPKVKGVPALKAVEPKGAIAPDSASGCNGSGKKLLPLSAAGTTIARIACRTLVPIPAYQDKSEIIFG